MSTDTQLLELVREGKDDDGTWDIIYQQFRSLLVAICKTTAPDLPPDSLDDVIQETILLVWQHVHQFDPSRGSAKSFLRGHAYNAIKKVRRCHSKNSTLSLDYPVGGEEGDGSFGDFIKDDADSIEEQSKVLEVEQILAMADSSAPPNIACALCTIYQEDLSFTEAARSIGVNRTSLYRHIRQWAQDMQLIQ